jgi:regulation of enolase protein 1 (concanavalin A-like superfamily)/photosystem II stability/assembly factor-like uncharacterized protein
MKKSILWLLFSTLSGIIMAQTSNWQFTGPSNFPVNISGQINGIGRVCQIQYNPLNNNSLFACSASGGLWKSVDNGLHWFSMGTDGLPKMATSAVCIDYTDTNIIYLSSGDPNYYGDDFGIWKTIDGGNNWSQITNGIGNRMALNLEMDPANHLTLIAATSNGIWRTTDGGNNWTNVLVGNQFTDMCWQPQAGTSLLYASSMNSFFRSVDKGVSWTQIVSGFNGLLASGTRLAVSANNPALVYVGTVNDEGTIFKSIDSGLNFSIQYHDTSRSLTGYDTTGGGQGNYNFCLEANPSNANELFLGSHCVWRSQDAGLHWDKLTIWSQKLHTDMHDLLFQPGNSANLFEANDGGVWLGNNDGTTWQPRSDGLGATENYHAAVSPLYAGLISTGTQDNGELIYTGGTWKTNRGGDWTTKMQMDYSLQQFVYYFTDKKRRALPSGSGDLYNVPSSITSTVMRHAFSPDNQNLGYVSGTSIWQTKNLSDAMPVWTQITPVTSSAKAIATCAGHPNIFAYSLSSKFFITHNALDAVPVFSNALFPVTASATDIVISSVDTNLVFVILTNSVYRSTDGGLTFTDYTGTLPAISQSRIFLDDYGGKFGLYCCNAQGVYYRNQTMSDWVNYSGALPTIAGITDFMYFNDGGVDARLYVSYFGRGVWETGLENFHTCQTPTINTSNVNGTQVQLSWNSVGAPQYEIEYRAIGDLSWINASSSSNSIQLSSLSGCTAYECRVRALCGSDASLWSIRTYFSTSSDPMNNDFDGHNDIGTVGAAGSVCYDAQHQRYTISASGADIWDQQDAFHFLYKQMQGDVTISARVKSIGNIYGWAKGGVMIRETLNADSKHTMCALTPGNGFANQWRTNTSDWTSNIDTAGKAPGWVKLERIGNLFTAYFSTDGNNWDVLNSTSIPMNNTVYVGLANCSHVDSTLNDAVFDHIVINDVALGNADIAVSNSPIQVYPNPANDILHIQFLERPSQSTHYLIHDMTGQVVSREVLKITGNQSEINISSLPLGVYSLEIFGNQHHITQFVKR